MPLPRQLAAQLAPFEMQFLRYFAAILVLLPFMLRSGFAAYRPKNLAGQLSRGAVHAVGLAMWFLALSHITLADTTAISFTTPIFVMVGAALVFREPMRWERWVAAGIGFDARVVEGLDLRLKRAIGKAAYVASALSALRRTRPQRYEIDVDGEPFTAAGVVVVKTRHYGGPYVIVPSARLDQPSLHVALFDSGGPKAIARYAAGLLSNSISNLSDVRILCAKQVTIRGPVGEKVQVDGDLHAELPLLATVSERPFRLLR